mmetsp:Transcript_37127/g.68536  ORF Transcript_37127/g.68536 Transcript_37127/m.68536 type:complete len:404 (-) Transcript_37127:255-1466(-)|eukprot:CAMPEP_0170170692 /NCGR_PEP_ID=MMETSP0040_2-20121228/3704_1 /TAXON_ID=641309 /ORGANISM="Lotharella oceanica, Strain CCMP622" /LENGTH=403 /DNA_ID=CAMNT_0010410251 /DNA_START=89 /DNA_END=1300 /DNA_ORIENTATION=-
MPGGSLKAKESVWYTIAVLTLISVCCAESVAFSVYNKWLFSGPLKAPVFVTAACQICCFVGASLTWGLSRGCSRFYRRAPIVSVKAFAKIMLIPISFVLNYGLNNLSLKFTTLALNQLIRSFSPVAIAVTSFLIEGKRQSWPKLISLLCLVGGVVMGVGTSPDFEYLGVLICAGSLLGQAVSIVMTALVMRDKTKLKPFDVLLYTALPSAIVLLPCSWVLGEANVVAQSIEDYGILCITGLLAIGGVFAFTFTLFYVCLIKLTSSVYYGVTGGFRCTVAIIISYFVFDQQMSATSVAGIVIAMLAFMFNSFFTLKEKLERISRASSGRSDGADEEEAEAEAVAAAAAAAEGAYFPSRVVGGSRGRSSRAAAAAANKYAHVDAPSAQKQPLLGDGRVLRLDPDV